MENPSQQGLILNDSSSANDIKVTQNFLGQESPKLRDRDELKLLRYMKNYVAGYREDSLYNSKHVYIVLDKEVDRSRVKQPRSDRLKFSDAPPQRYEDKHIVAIFRPI